MDAVLVEDYFGSRLDCANASVAVTLRLCDGVIVGSWLKEDHDAYADVSEAYVREFVAAARSEK